MLYETFFLIALLLTLIIEIPILFIFLKYIFKLKIKDSKIIFVGFLASTLTIPYLWFIFPAYINDYFIYIIIGEFLVFLFEAFMYNQLINLRIDKALLVSFVANLSSFTIGLLIL